VDEKRLYFVARDAAVDAKRVLKTFPIDNKKPELETFKDDIVAYERSLDRKKLMVRTERRSAWPSRSASSTRCSTARDW
jgi:hypothetical protein